VAFEMAGRLRNRGAEVPLLVMFNAPSTRYNRRYTPYFDADGAMVDARGRLRADLAPRDGSVRASLRRHASSGSAAARARALAGAAGRRVRADGGARARQLRLETYLRLRRPLPDDLREATAFQLIAARAQNVYEPAVLDVPILVFRSQGLYYEDDLGWRPHSSIGVEGVEVPGEHLTPRDLMDQPAVAIVAEHLGRSIGRTAMSTTSMAAA
jgi:thioesterase domain-containing protein